MLKKNLFARFMNAVGEDGSDTGGETVGSSNDARVAMLERINDLNDQLRADELADVNEDGTTTEFRAALPMGDPEDAAVIEQELARATQEVTTDDVDAELAEEMFQIKVNGKTIPLTRSQLIERAQKVEAADTYLAEASRIRKAADHKTQSVSAPTPNREAQESAALEDRRALVRAIQIGTEEEAMAALEKLQRPAPSVTADDMARTVDERLNFKSAVAKFETDFSDVMSDPLLREVALRRDSDALAAGDTRGYWERYSAIGEDLRAWKKQFASPAPVVLPAAETKQSRKATIAPPPQLASRKAPAAQQEDDREESVTDVISAIARARGGPQWARA
jgi:hypothetical protein